MSEPLDQASSSIPTDSPVLSHAQKRRLKRKRGEDDPSASGPQAQNSPQSTIHKEGSSPKAEREPKRPKGENGIWVGNLSFDTTEDDIKTFFKDAGAITRINMPMKRTGPKLTNKGFVYVDFASAEGQAVAIALSEKNLHGRRLLIKDCASYEGSKSVVAMSRPDGKPFVVNDASRKILNAQKQSPCPVLFMGNLPFTATEESIRDHLHANLVRWSDRKKGVPQVKHKKGKIEQSDKTVLSFESEQPQPIEETESEEEADDPPEATPDLGLRKIRLGTFQDTGKCKGWAFLDFVDTPHATVSLLRTRNHYMDGRQVVLEFASPDAVRRNHSDEQVKQRGTGRFAKDAKASQKTRPRGFPSIHLNDPEVVKGSAESATEEKRHPKYGTHGPPHRQKPGAALAQAARKSVGIVQSQGKKTVF
ncbi:hypothetical protein FRB99_001237 [Tulasnella sp. 403]|nr:hypothetical protein FRB99_001237 [Tulasnella sp. 403]